MKILNLEQGSQEWLDYRKTKCMASDSAAICGVDQYRTAYQVWLNKLGLGKPIEENEDMRRGKQCEPIARELLNKKFLAKFEPIVVESETYPWMAASLDGIYFNTTAKWICEIKCPRSTGHEAVKQRMIPDRYMIQMQQQLLVTGADLCFFCSYCDDDLEVIGIYPDEVVQIMIINETKKFWHENVLGFTAPEMKPGDFVERNDIDFYNFADKWKEVQKRKKEIEEEERVLREKLLQATNGENTRGFGLTVTNFLRKGSVQYDKIEALKCIDLEQYRKAPSLVTMIRTE